MDGPLANYPVRDFSLSNGCYRGVFSFRYYSNLGEIRRGFSGGRCQESCCNAFSSVIYGVFAIFVPVIKNPPTAEIVVVEA